MDDLQLQAANLGRCFAGKGTLYLTSSCPVSKLSSAYVGIQASTLLQWGSRVT